MGILMVTCPVTGDDFSTGIYMSALRTNTPVENPSSKMDRIPPPKQVRSIISVAR